MGIGKDSFKDKLEIYLMKKIIFKGFRLNSAPVICFGGTINLGQFGIMGEAGIGS